jgi:hypothetical protein
MQNLTVKHPKSFLVNPAGTVGGEAMSGIRADTRQPFHFKFLGMIFDIQLAYSASCHVSAAPKVIRNIPLLNFDLTDKSTWI